MLRGEWVVHSFLTNIIWVQSPVSYVGRSDCRPLNHVGFLQVLPFLPTQMMPLHPHLSQRAIFSVEISYFFIVVKKIKFNLSYVSNLCK